MDEQICRRCELPAASADFEVFERMHYVCFHYEFEHTGVDVDDECSAGGCPSRRAGLDRSLADWSDWDLAAFLLGRAIGFYETIAQFQRHKDDYLSADPLGSGLHDALVTLAEAGLLERRDEPKTQFRWGRRTEGKD